MTASLRPDGMATNRSGSRLARFLDAVRVHVPLAFRRMSTAERRQIQRMVANDPDVDRALREALAAQPRFRGKGLGGGVSRRYP